MKGHMLQNGNYNKMMHKDCFASKMSDTQDTFYRILKTHFLKNKNLNEPNLILVSLLEKKPYSMDRQLAARGPWNLIRSTEQSEKMCIGTGSIATRTQDLNTGGRSLSIRLLHLVRVGEVNYTAPSQL